MGAAVRLEDVGGAAIAFAGGAEAARAAESGKFLTTGAGRPLSDQESLLARAASGDRAAFREVYVRHRSDVARLVFRMLGPRPDAEDVIQEVFFQVFRSLKDFRGQAKFTTWLHRVTVNVVLMHRRSAKSRPVFTDEQPADAMLDSREPQPDEEFARRERVRAFQRLLDRLADKKRVVFVLHELEGMAPAEIAKVVGAPVLTVRTRLFYARRELQAMLAEEPTLAGMASELAADAAADGADAADARSEESVSANKKAAAKAGESGIERQDVSGGERVEASMVAAGRDGGGDGESGSNEKRGES